MKKTVSWLWKALLSGLLAIAVLSTACMLYYNIPVHSSVSSGATDYAWGKNTFYSRGTEGFAWGKTNNEGYLNTYDYEEGMDIDVLVMGSSHMEAYNVAMDESTAAQLNALLGEKSTYNIGVSGHNFLTCSNNLEAALDKYAPSRYVVIETSGVSFTREQLDQAIAGEIEEQDSHAGGILSLLQRNPLLRLLYAQLSNWSNAQNQNSDQSSAQEDAPEQTYLALLQQMSETATEHGVGLVIVYHSPVQIDPETGMAIFDRSEAADNFAAYCESSGIIFVDMSERFVKEYNENHILPHGFSNSSVGSGHLNRYGHKMIAEELFNVIGGDR